MKVQLRAAKGGALAHPRLQALCLEASDPRANLAVTGRIARDDEAARWTLEVRVPRPEKANRLEHNVRLPASETARLLERTLRRPMRDDALLDAVAWADTLRGEELACA